VLVSSFCCCFDSLYDYSTEAKILELMIWENWIKPFFYILMVKLTLLVFKTKDVSFFSLSLSLKCSYIKEQQINMFLISTDLLQFRKKSTCFFFFFFFFHFSLKDSLRQGLFWVTAKACFRRSISYLPYSTLFDQILAEKWKKML